MMGQMKRLWGELTEREQAALSKLNEIARTTDHPWLRQRALMKARELEQAAWDRARDGMDLDLARLMRDPRETGFGRYGA